MMMRRRDTERRTHFILTHTHAADDKKKSTQAIGTVSYLASSCFRQRWGSKYDNPNKSMLEHILEHLSVTFCSIYLLHRTCCYKLWMACLVQNKRRFFETTFSDDTTSHRSITKATYRVRIHKISFVVSTIRTKSRY